MGLGLWVVCGVLLGIGGGGLGLCLGSFGKIAKIYRNVRRNRI